VNLGSPSTPLLEIRKQAVIDATASHTFISPNALPGQILAHIRSGLRVACDHKFGNAHRRPKPNTICLGSSGLPSMKRSGRKDSGSSYISGFLVISLRDILKELSQLRIGGKRKVQTICLPLRENPWEYDIQDIGHFESMYGESLWRKKVPVSSTYCKMERPESIPKVRGGCHLHYILAREDHAGIRSDVPVQLHNKCFKIWKGTTVCKVR
jgi:hypothetical protein